MTDHSSLRSQPSRISLRYLLGDLGVSNCQQVRGLRSRCSSTPYKAHTRGYDRPPDISWHQMPHPSAWLRAYAVFPLVSPMRRLLEVPGVCGIWIFFSRIGKVNSKSSPRGRSGAEPLRWVILVVICIYTHTHVADYLFLRSLTQNERRRLGCGWRWRR
jgi:hypothetical protein